MKKRLLIITIIASFLFSSCWDSREINELGLVMAVGIDKSRDSLGYKVTVQIARPSAAANTGGQTGGGDTVWIGGAEGSTIFDAIRNISKFSSRRVMWAHNNIIIIGEELAREGITPIVDFFTHNPELRMKTWVAVCRGEASAIVEAQTGMETIPALSISRLYRYNDIVAKNIRTDMLTLFRDYRSETIQPIISTLNLLKKGDSGAVSTQVELSGGTVFKKDKLVGFLSPNESRGISWIRNEAKNAAVSVGVLGVEDKEISIEIRNIKTKIESEYKNNRAYFKIDFYGKGSITEQDFPKNMDIEEFKLEVQNKANEKIKKQIKLSIDTVQKEYNSDVLGLGRTFHIQNKKLWNTEVKGKWDELYSKAVITVNTDVKIHSSTLFQIPIKLDKSKEKSNESQD